MVVCSLQMMKKALEKKEAELLGWVVLMITRTAIILSSRQFLSYDPLNQGEIKRDERDSDLFGVANVR